MNMDDLSDQTIADSVAQTPVSDELRSIQTRIERVSIDASDPSTFSGSESRGDDDQLKAINNLPVSNGALAGGENDSSSLISQARDDDDSERTTNDDQLKAINNLPVSNGALAGGENDSSSLISQARDNDDSERTTNDDQLNAINSLSVFNGVIAESDDDSSSAMTETRATDDPGLIPLCDNRKWSDDELSIRKKALHIEKSPCVTVSLSKEQKLILEEANLIKAIPEIYSLQIFQDEDEGGKQVFREDCEKLRNTLLNPLVAQAKEDRLIVSNVKRAEIYFISLILTWEEEILEQSYHTVSEHFGFLDTNTALSKDTLWEVYTVIRMLHAKRLVTNSSPANVSEILRPYAQYKSVIMDVVALRWKRWYKYSSSMSNYDKATLLFALMKLWQVDKCEGIIQENGNENFISTCSQVLNKTKRKELQLLKSKATVFDERNQIIMYDMADDFFCTAVYSSGVPLKSEKIVEKYQAELKNGLWKTKKDVTKYNLLFFYECELLKTLLKNVTRIRNPKFWLHYSGHGCSDGIVGHTPIGNLHKMMRAAGRLVANVVVTLDCCYADSTLSPVEFCVDGTAYSSGCTTISSCLSYQTAKYSSRLSWFTELIILALWSGVLGECLHFSRRVYENNDTKLCEDTNSCHGCKNYTDRQQNKPCMGCADLRNQWREKKCISVDNLADYIGHHLCRKGMLPVITIHKPVHGTQLPLAFFNEKRPIYQMPVMLISGRPIVDVTFNALPEKKQEAKEIVLRKTLWWCLDNYKTDRALVEDIGRHLACPLVGCSKQSGCYACLNDALMRHVKIFDAARNDSGSTLDVTQSTQRRQPQQNEHTVLGRLSFTMVSGDRIGSDDDLKMAFLRSSTVNCRISLEFI